LPSSLPIWGTEPRRGWPLHVTVDAGLALGGGDNHEHDLGEYGDFGALRAPQLD